jgi:hypothetical protein
VKNNTALKTLRSSKILWAIILIASLFPIHLRAQIPAPQVPTPTFSKSANTLISGIVLTNYDLNISSEVEVILSCGWNEIARLTTRGGLFSIDLASIANPWDTITIGIEPGPKESSKVNEAKDSTVITTSLPEGYTWNYPFNQTYSNPNAHGGLLQKVCLTDAQNLNLKIWWNYPLLTATISDGPFGWNPPWQVVATDFAVFTTTVQLITPPATTSTPNIQDRSCTKH